MDQTTLRDYILQTFPGTTAVDASGGSFFFTDPERKFPYATLVTSDHPFQHCYFSFSSIRRCVE
jgi:hypothetical protein